MGDLVPAANKKCERGVSTGGGGGWNLFLPDRLRSGAALLALALAVQLHLNERLRPLRL
jgi:hypothetical protein